MTQDDHRVISLDDARRRRRARELLEADGRAREETPGDEPIRISDAMSHLLEGGDETEAGEGPSAGHLRQIVEREFADEGDDDSDPDA